MTLTVCDRRREDATGWAAVLFDLDGTLIDSQLVHEAAYVEALQSVGLPLDGAAYRAAHAHRFDVAIDVMLDGRDPVVSAQELHQRKAAAFSRLVQRDGLRLLPAAGLVPLLAGRVPIGLVTSASEATVAIVLRRLGWEDVFDVVVHGGDHVLPKPSPAPYLDAARRLGAAADGCLVFEDTDVGVAAARGAGMAVIDVRTASVP